VREARAKQAWYERNSRELVLVLEDGREVRFPVDIMQGLTGANDDELSRVKLSPQGYGVYWETETLDAHFSVQGLLDGIFGTRAWMAKLREE